MARTGPEMNLCEQEWTSMKGLGTQFHFVLKKILGTQCASRLRVLQWPVYSLGCIRL